MLNNNVSFTEECKLKLSFDDRINRSMSFFLE